MRLSAVYFLSRRKEMIPGAALIRRRGAWQVSWLELIRLPPTFPAFRPVAGPWGPRRDLSFTQ